MERGRLYPQIRMDSEFHMDDTFYEDSYTSIFQDKMPTSSTRDHEKESLHSNEKLVQDIEQLEDLDKSQSLFFDGSETGLFKSIISENDRNDEEQEDLSQKDHNLGGRYFYYDMPHVEETGAWIPVSVPPLSESEHDEWLDGVNANGGYLPEEDPGWQHEDQDLTMWTVVRELLSVIPVKVASSLAGARNQSMCLQSNRRLPRGMLEQAWKEMAQTLTDSTYNVAKDILDAEPPRWIPDSAAIACMLCNVRFHPIMCPRHHCRFCGGIFCGNCSRGRSLLPEKFRISDPQRVCDVCWVRLESVQGLLISKVSHAAQPATHDVTDLSTIRSWLNFPWGQSMQYEIYKATNTVRGFVKIGSLRPERSIPATVLQGAKGLAILTVIKVGVMVTYKVGTGLVVVRKEDNSWSPPVAISSVGVGWGAQGGGELTDFIIVLRTEEAVKTFSGNIHFSIGAGLSAAAGPIGRVVEADLRAGTGGSAACFTYSCSKGAFVGCSLEGNVVTSRNSTNAHFYGNSSIKVSDILLGSVAQPLAASPLYKALSDLFDKACNSKVLLT